MPNDLLSDIPNYPGLVSPGNIDLYNRPVLKNDDGTVSTVRSMMIDADGKYILIPTIVGGELLDDEAAISHFRNTKENLGVFGSMDAANAYDRQMHDKMGWVGDANQWPAPMYQGTYDFSGMFE